MPGTYSGTVTITAAGVAGSPLSIPVTFTVAPSATLTATPTSLNFNYIVGTANPPASYGQHTPPGAPNWHLPPPERKMIFIHQSKADLCATIKDTKRNGGKDLAALLEHVSHDKLVLWGWNPGVGRAPVSIPHDAFVASFKTWIAGGAPCPDSPQGQQGR